MIRLHFTKLRNAGLAVAFLAAQVVAVASPFMAGTAHAASTAWSTPTATHSPNDWDVNTVANVQSSNNVYITEDDGSEQGYSFNLPALPAGSVIDGIEVQAEAKSSDSNGCRLGVALSWNGGSNYTNKKYMDLGNSDATETLGGASNDWGHTWSVSQFSAANFVLKVEDNDPGPSCDNSAVTSVDQLQVRVHYTEPLTPAANPVLSSSCGLDIALVIDNSNSINSSEMTSMKSALKGFTNALDGTPTQFSVTRFGTSATVISSFTNDVAATNTAIDGVNTGGGGTNWEDGLLKAYGTFDPRADKPNLVIFASDGNPTYHIGGGSGSSTSQADIDAAVVQANVIKNAGTRMLALGIGNDLSLANLKSISGPNANTGNVLTSDVISSDFSTLAADLAVFAAQTCGGTITTKKLIDADGSLATTNDRTPASNWSFDVNGTPSNPDATTTDATGFTPAVNVQPGTYSVGETQKTGYTLLSASCTGANNNGSKQGDGVTGIQVNANNIVSCTFINTLKRGTITVNKVTNPAGDQTSFPITASGTGNISGNAIRNVTTSSPVVYDVAQGTYNVSENVPAGWSQASNTCSNIVVGPNNLNPTCTITNTKLGSLTIIKDALPNDAQDFTFGVTGLPGGNFLLDDDANPTLSNQKVFNNLAPGQYSVTEQSTPGWSLTSLKCGSNTTQGATATVNLTAGQNVTCTFTNTKLGSLSGTKYTANADASLGPVLSGWTIFIDSNNNGVLDDGEQSTVTDSNGAYSFSNLLPSTYVLREVIQAGWTQIFGAGSVNLSTGQNSTNNNFGNFQNGSIYGFKWNDKDGDGVVDEGENKLNGWTINLYNGQNVLITSTTTTNGGNYSFGNLAPGTYGVCETQQTGWVQTYPANNGCHTIVIDQSGESNQANFGNQGRATITVKKVVSPADDSGKFNLLINGTIYATNVGDGGTTGSIAVPAGTYTVSETAGTATNLNDYTTTNACSWGNRGGGGDGTSVSDLTVNAGENLVCTFTNTRSIGSIKVVKHVVNNNGGTKTVSDFHFTFDGTQYSFDQVTPTNGEKTMNLPVGSGPYTITEPEANTMGYATSYDNCSNLTVTAGQTQTCTITNDDVAPGLTVTKVVLNPYGTPIPPSSFPLFVDGTSVTSGTQNTQFNAGNHTITETQQPGYTFVGVSGDCILTEGQINILLAIGINASCTLTNTAVQPKLIVIKHVVNDNSGTKSASDFTMMVSGNSQVVPNFPGNESGTEIGLNEGSYSVDELADAGYTKSLSADCAGTISVGQVKTCTITNNDVAHPAVTVVKSGPAAAHEGDTVTYSFAVTNTGDTATLSGVTVADNIAGNATYVSGDTNSDGLLQKGETWIFSADYTIPAEHDADVTNTATACGFDPAQTKACGEDNHTLDVLHPALQVVKTASASAANPGDTVTYAFTVTNTGDTPLSITQVNDSIAGAGVYLSGDTNENSKLDLDETWVYTVDYIIPAEQADNVTNTVTVCANDTLRGEACDEDSHELTILSKVVVTKYNDLNRNGWFDEGEPIIPNWTFSLNSGWNCSEYGLVGFLSKATFSDDGCYDYNRSQVTGADGTATFSDVMPGYSHELTETQQDGWHLSNMDCGDISGGMDGDIFYISGGAIKPGHTVYCYVGNYHDAHLDITKHNDATTAVNPGATVTYTVVVSVPEDSGAVFDAVAYDILPNGLTYVPGSWTSTSPATTDPLFNPTGVWQLGDLYPGDSVTLTYKATVNADAKDGTYTNVAYGEGCAVTMLRPSLYIRAVTEESSCDESVYTDEAKSTVEVSVPHILATSTTKKPTVLANTGAGNIVQNTVIAALLLFSTLSLAVVSRRQKTQTK